MEFCPRCGLALIAKKEEDKTFLVCRKCGYKTDKYKPLQISEKLEKDPLNDVVVVQKDLEALPKAKVECPKCGNKKAVWWLQQTRSVDEAPTTFFRCTKCKHAWREYG